MRRLYWLAVAAVVLTASAVAFGAASAKSVTVTGEVQAVSSSLITVNGTTCVFAPTNSRMMMPAIIRDVGVGDTATMTCVTRASVRPVVARIVERPAAAVIARGTVTGATTNSITIRGLTCTFSVTGFPNPRIMAPTTIRGDLGLMACLRQNGQNVVTAAAELTREPGRVVLVSGHVSSISSTSVTVSGVTCTLARTAKPLPGMPTWIKGVEVGDNVLLACAAFGNHLVATGVTDR